MNNSIKGFKGIFRWALVIKLILQNLLRINKIIKIRSFADFYKLFISWEVNGDTLRFVTVASLINCTFKAILCILRRYLKSDKLSAPIAGFIAGLWLFFESKWRRGLYMVLLMSKAIDAILNFTTSRV